MMQSINLGLAPAFSFFPNLNPPHKTFTFHQILVLIVTFIAYASFHASRKPLSIVKSVLGPSVISNSSSIDPNSIDNGWAPFNGKEGTRRLGELDLAFLSSYALGMYFSGQLGDRVDLRFFLVFGMIGSGILTIVFALGFWMNIHLLGFYMSVQIICGLFQSIGWPSVVAVVGNWFGKEKRGLIMGVWNSHTSVGNIVGSLVASSLLEFGWGWSFALPGFLVIVSGLLVFLFLVVRPQDLGYEEVEKEIEMMSSVDENLRKLEAEDVGLLETSKDLNESMVSIEDIRLLETPKEVNESMFAIEDVRLLETPKELNESMVAIKDLETPKESKESMEVAIGFIEAWRLPGVTPFAFCLFFSKLVAYTFLYWLPYYLRHTAVAGVHLSHKTAGILSTVFDIGGVFGGVSAGYISDKIKARALTSITFLSLSIPVLVMYRTYGSVSMFINIVLMFLSGLLVNGPYALITTAVAADLGTQDSIRGNSRALATVTAIIDGTGSVGAALGPLLAGYISARGWNSVFLMLIVSIFFAGLFLLRLAKAEMKEMKSSATSDPQNR